MDLKKCFQLIIITLMPFALLQSCSNSVDSDASDSIPEVSVENPYFSDDFEGYENGTSLSAHAPFDAAGRTVASDEQSYSGTTSAKMEIRESDGGAFGMWGGVVPLQPTIAKGGEVWVRFRVFWPESFEFSAFPYMKFMRLHTKIPSGENSGYNDLYIDKADDTLEVLRCIKEKHNIWEVYNGHKIPRNTWETYEMYLFVDDISVNDGGDARMRVWRDGELIFDRTDVPTINQAGGEVDYFYLFTYWNNETPPNNYVYVDDLVITTHLNPPSFRDSDGHLFIGE